MKITNRRWLSTVMILSIVVFAAFQAFCQNGNGKNEKAAPKQEKKTATAVPVEIPVEAPETAVETDVSDKDVKAATVVYYFYTTQRCYSCNLIEDLTKKAVEENFAEQIKNGRVVIKPINIDEEPNKHFIKDYKLYTKSVIVSDVKGGKEERWKNLEQVWMLLRDQNRFKYYIKTEVEGYLKG